MTEIKTEYKLSEKKTCPYCQSLIKSENDTIYCNFCGTPHHKECWKENSGCTTYGCRNSNITERKTDEQTGEETDIGNRTIDEIENLLNKNDNEPDAAMLICFNCKNSVDENSIYCKYCGVKLDDKGKMHLSEFEMEFQKKSKDNRELKKKIMYLTYSSILILSVLFCFIFYFSFKIIDSRINSDEYKIKSMMYKWNSIYKSRETDKLKSFYEIDFIYYDKSGNENSFEKRFKQITAFIKNEKYKNVYLSDFQYRSDSTSLDYAFINIKQTFYYEKEIKSEKKYFKLYKNSETGDWKIFREYFEF